MSSLTASASAGEFGSDASRPIRLLVTVRRAGEAAARRTYQHVGFLESRDNVFEFYYCEHVDQSPDFLPLSGFPDVTRRYSSADMFPLFAERIMSARRPDRALYLNALDLGPDSEPWEILARSGGRRAGDTIEVTPEPLVSADGETTCSFLVHGIRYRGRSASEAIDQLRPGDDLRVRWESSNEVNPRAVLVLDSSDVELGYVPDPLVDYVHTVIENPHALRVLRANGPEVGPHLRLLVRLEGRVNPSYLPFGSRQRV